PRPPSNATRVDKQRYAQRLSSEVAVSMAEDLRAHGLGGCLPDPPRGVEREFAGGIGAKKVDGSWSSEEAGLLLAISVKTVNFADSKTGNYQKNLTNRRGDMLFETVTLHRRFPYAVIGGLLLLHEGARSDDQGRERRSTFENAHDRFRIFTGRADPGGREEQFERAWIGLYTDSPPSLEIYRAGEPQTALTWGQARDELLQVLAERNPDHFVLASDRLERF
ncbi:MAG: hypothetical protein ACYC6V_10770, partial [Bacillota bacterium]